MSEHDDIILTPAERAILYFFAAIKGADEWTAAAALRRLIDAGLMTYAGEVGSEPVITDAGRAWVDTHGSKP